jgi:hypothetical protein
MILTGINKGIIKRFEDFLNRAGNSVAIPNLSNKKVDTGKNKNVTI